MDTATILKVFIFSIAISMDAFAVAVTDGLIYKNLSKRHKIFIALIFAIMQMLMPLIGYWFIEIFHVFIGEKAGQEAGNILATVITWVAFSLLLFVGLKMLIEGIKAIKKKEENLNVKEFSIKEVLLYGVITSIDAMAVGVSFQVGISDNITIFLHVAIIFACTFIICLIGVFLGNFFNKLFKSKYQITTVIGGSILILLSIWVVLSHYLAI